MTALLATHQLTAGYGQLRVLHGLDLEVNEGEVVVILGANGAGKTTTMRAISGTIGRQGQVVFDGTDITTAPCDAIVKAGVALVPQGRGTFPELTVEDNLRAGAITRSGPIDKDIQRWFGMFPRLEERRHQKAGQMSGGEQQMLAIARALMSHPRLLLCDEPSLGLAPLITKELFETLAALNREEGLSVLLVEQNANLAMHMASRVYLLETGRVVGVGTAAEMEHDENLRKAYLGF